MFFPIFCFTVHKFINCVIYSNLLSYRIILQVYFKRGGHAILFSLHCPSRGTLHLTFSVVSESATSSATFFIDCIYVYWISHLNSTHEPRNEKNKWNRDRVLACLTICICRTTTGRQTRLDCRWTPTSNCFHSKFRSTSSVCQ